MVGVKTYWDHLIADVALSRTGFVQNVDVRSRSGQPREDAGADEAEEGKTQVTDSGDLRIPCIALLCCNYKQCDKDVFSAINDCGLVFDGGLVVDAVCFFMTRLLVLFNVSPQSFCTVDPAIYGVADFTRFSRMYKDSLPHSR